ncbi:MAG: AAA family ATPase [Oscillospiraceae bacterium]|nr:AAA family ATPase [Oscillospiraceae bacterium]
MAEAKILAVAGKGGVGKTSVSAAMVRLLVKAFPDKRILAIDADPAVGLSTALGVDPGTTLDDIRKAVTGEVTEREGGGVGDILESVKGRLLDAMRHLDGYDFFAIGRPETAGCYCAVNTYLRQVISLLIHDYDYVVVDSEAGIEQVNRRVLEKVTHLILVSDASKKGTQVIQTVKRVADELVMYERCGAIINRVTDPAAMDFVDTGDIPILAVIGEDADQTEFDILGKSVFDLPEQAKMLRGTAQTLQQLNIL